MNNNAGLRVLKVYEGRDARMTGEIVSLDKLRGIFSDDYVWSWLEFEDSFLLPSNEDEYLEALKIQEQQYRVANDRFLRIVHPTVLAAFSKAYHSYDDMSERFYVYYDGWRCECEWGDGMFEVVDLAMSRTPHINDMKASDEDVVSGGVLLNKILSKSMKDCLLLDAVEYNLEIVITKNGVVRDVVNLFESATTIPTIRRESLPCDLICNANLSLHFSGRKLDVDLNRLIGIVPNDGVIKIEASVDANKMVSLKIQNGSKTSEHRLSELLLN